MWLQLRNCVMDFASLNGEKLKAAKLQMDPQWKHVLKPLVSNFIVSSYKIIQETQLLEKRRWQLPLPYDHADTWSVSMICLLDEEFVL